MKYGGVARMNVLYNNDLVLKITSQDLDLASLNTRTTLKLYRDFMRFGFGEGYALRDPSMWLAVQNLQPPTNPRPRQLWIHNQKFDLRRLSEEEITEVRAQDEIKRQKQDEAMARRLQRKGFLHRNPLLARLDYASTS